MFEKSIKVKLLLKKDGELRFKLLYSRSVERYFKSDTFFVKYDADIDDVDESILYIPVISNLAPVSWAIGADLHVDRLDNAYISSLHTIKNVMKRMYPDFSCSGRLYVEHAESNRFDHNRAAQLFTAGVDSMATYARHKVEKPDIISFRTYSQLTPPLQRRIDQELAEFAQKEKVKLHLVESNLTLFIREKRLIAEYGRCLPEASWWASVQHGTGLLGLCAPITAAMGVNNVYIGSSYSSSMKEDPWSPWGSHKYIDDNMAWADTVVSHDCSDLSRQEKIGVIKEYGRQRGGYPSLIVCNDANRGTNLNCSACEKCYRTMAGLALGGIDPNECGFRMDCGTFEEIMKKLVYRDWSLIRKQPDMWRDIKGAIPETITEDIYGSKAFFQWLRSEEIQGNKQPAHKLFSIFTRRYASK
jgi:hypothetical protein